MSPADPQERAIADQLAERAGTHIDATEFEAALLLCEEALAHDPRHATALFRKAIALHCLGRPDAVEDLFDAALRHEPTNALAWNGRGAWLNDIGRKQEAVACYRRAAELDPAFDRPHFNLGAVHFEAGRFAEAVREFSEAWARNPRFLRSLQMRAEAFVQQERFAEALADYDTLLEREPENVPYQVDRGAVLSALGRQEEALAVAEAIAAREPLHWNACRLRVKILLELGRASEALELLRAFLDERPEEIGAVLVYAEILHRAEQRTEAMALLEDYLGRHPDAAEAWKLLGRCHGAERAFDESLDAFEQALKHDPQDGATWFLRGITLLFLESFTEAVTSIERAIELAPENTEWRLHHAAALGRAARHRESMVVLEELRAQGETPEVLLMMAENMAALGDEVGAAEYKLRAEMIQRQQREEATRRAEEEERAAHLAIEQAVERALATAETQREKVSVLMAVVEEALEQGRLAVALRFAQDAVHTSADGLPAEELLKVRCQVARVLIQMGRLDEATTLLREVIAAARQKAARLAEAMAADYLGLVLRRQEQPEEAVLSHERAVALFSEEGDTGSAMLSRMHLAMALDAAGNLDDAAAMLRRVIAYLEDIPRRQGDLAAALDNLASIRVRQDDPEEARTLMERALAIFATLGARVDAAKVMLNLGRLESTAGRAREAVAVLLKALEALEGREERALEAEAHTRLGVIFHALGETTLARRAFGYARTIHLAAENSEALEHLEELLAELGIDPAPDEDEEDSEESADPDTPSDDRS